MLVFWQLFDFLFFVHTPLVVLKNIQLTNK
jgi:hypothetical protein